MLVDDQFVLHALRPQDRAAGKPGRSKGRCQYLTDFGKRHLQLARSLRGEFVEDLYADGAARLDIFLASAQQSIRIRRVIFATVQTEQVTVVIAIRR